MTLRVLLSKLKVISPMVLNFGYPSVVLHSEETASPSLPVARVLQALILTWAAGAFTV